MKNASIKDDSRIESNDYWSTRIPSYIVACQCRKIVESANICTEGFFSVSGEMRRSYCKEMDFDPKIVLPILFVSILKIMKMILMSSLSIVQRNEVRDTF